MSFTGRGRRPTSRAKPIASLEGPLTQVERERDKIRRLSPLAEIFRRLVGNPYCTFVARSAMRCRYSSYSIALEIGTLWKSFSCQLAQKN
jgi:hypothetical protein